MGGMIVPPGFDRRAKSERATICKLRATQLLDPSGQPLPLSRDVAFTFFYLNVSHMSLLYPVPLPYARPC